MPQKYTFCQYDANFSDSYIIFLLRFSFPFKKKEFPAFMLMMVAKPIKTFVTVLMDKIKELAEVAGGERG